MAATYPSGIKTFTTKAPGDAIQSAHINDLQAEVVAIETELKKTTGSSVDHGGLAGLSDNDHPQYLLTTGTAADSSKLGGVLASAYLKTPSGSTTNPVPTAETGSFTSVSSACRTITYGKTRIFQGFVYITNAGTAAGAIKVSIPSGAPANVFSGGKFAGAGVTANGIAATCTLNPASPYNTYIELRKYDGTTLISTGQGIQFTILYELA